MFLHAVMLAGLGAAVVPIVLHLLSRARYRTIEWGAMMFLTDTTARLKNRSRLAQWLLLALRVLAIALLALALARPVLRRAAGPIGGHGLAVAVVIDGSPSMLHPEQNTTRFELARKAALGVLGDLHAGDEAALIELGASYATDTPPTTDLQRIASRLASLDSAAGPADLADGVRHAESLLANRAEVAREIYVFADRQKSTWQSLASMPHDPATRVVVVPVGSTENRNVAVESIDLLDPPAVAGLAARVRVKIHNWSDGPRGDLPLTISTGGSVIERTTLNLAQGATEEIVRPITFPHAGSAVVTAAIAPSGMPGDDAAMLAVNVSEPLRVLTISGEPAGRLQHLPSPALTGTCDYLALALDPFAGDAKSTSPFHTQFLPDAPWPKPDARQDRVVILADTAALDEDAVRSLEQFVFAGGGLLLAPGPHVAPDDWNRWLWKDGQGLAPASFDSVQTGPATSLVGVQTASPVFAFFGGVSSSLPSIDVARWAKFSPHGDVLASLKSGDPFLLEHAFGRGRVIAMAGPLDASWSNLPLTRLYLPMMQSIVRRLASANEGGRNLSIGSPLEATIDGPKNANVDIVRPDGRVDRVRLSMTANVGTLVYTATDVPGRYTLRGTGQGETAFIVRPMPQESDLSLQDDAALREIIASSHIDFAVPAAPLGVGASRKASEWSIPLILLAIVALAIESMITTRLATTGGQS